MTEPVADLERRLQRALGHAAAQITALPPDWDDRERSLAQRSKRTPRGLSTIAERTLIAMSVAVTVAIFAGAMLLVAHRRPVTPAPPRPTVAAKPPATAASEASLVARIHRLRGTPIVILAWASWCGPCQPNLQRVLRAVAHLHQVKFLLADTNDSRTHAHRILMRHGLSDPFYETQVTLRGILAGPLPGLPALILINRHGEVAYVRPGEYPSVAAIEHDIKARLLNR